MRRACGAAGRPIQIRVGLNSGEVVVRAIGSDLHMDYTAVGQTPTWLPAWEQLAESRILRFLTAETLALTRGLRAGDRARAHGREGIS